MSAKSFPMVLPPDPYCLDIVTSFFMFCLPVIQDFYPKAKTSSMYYFIPSPAHIQVETAPMPCSLPLFVL